MSCSSMGCLLSFMECADTHLVTSTLMYSPLKIGVSTRRRGPVLGGPEINVLWQMSVCQPVFLIEFHVGCSTNCTATEKNMCVIFHLYRCRDGNNRWKSNAPSAICTISALHWGHWICIDCYCLITYKDERWHTCFFQLPYNLYYSLHEIWSKNRLTDSHLSQNIDFWTA